MSIEATDFSLPNVGPGPDPPSALAADHESADRDTEVVSIVPEPHERVREWQDSYDPPYPIVADPEATAGEAYDLPVRFGLLGDWSDFLGRMPEAVLVDLRDGPAVAWSYRSKPTFDRPSVDDLLDAADEARTR